MLVRGSCWVLGWLVVGAEGWEEAAQPLSDGSWDETAMGDQDSGTPVGDGWWNSCR